MEEGVPDPPNSPAHYARNLSIHGFPTITTEDAGADGWTRTFSNAVLLEFYMDRPSLLPFCGISLRLTNPPSEVFDLVDPFPLLEDLVLVYSPPKSNAGGWDAPSKPPKLTGILNLWTFARTRPVARRSVDPHFTGIMRSSSITMPGW